MIGGTFFGWLWPIEIKKVVEVFWNIPGVCNSVSYYKQWRGSVSFITLFRRYDIMNRLPYSFRISLVFCKIFLVKGLSVYFIKSSILLLYLLKEFYLTRPSCMFLYSRSLFCIDFLCLLWSMVLMLLLLLLLLLISLLIWWGLLLLFAYLFVTRIFF